MLNNPEISNSVLSIFKEQIGEQDTSCKKCAETLHGEVLTQAEEVASSISAEWSKQCDKLCAEITSLQSLNDGLQNENATLKVDVSTLKSQVNSLQTQQTALQLANSQLVAEKDEIARDLRSEVRTLKETNNTLESKVLNMELEKDSLRTDARSLGNLRAEHSKLKDDFRNLFTASERLKQEYRAVQEELKSVRTESRNLRLGQTEMQGELNSRSDRMASLQLENAKLQQKCDMLFEMNHSLDSDRRALMDHVSQLLSQYHSLLTHSLEDKQHYHVEEKLYTDKVNNLCRQKEKLEEKIMEHYRKLDNASSKKRGFGATLVRRVRKAGSDIINKVPSRNRRSWHEDTSRLTQSQFTLLGDGSGESNGNNSDNSMEDSGNRSEPFKRNVGGSGDQMYCREPGSALSLGSVGSRRTVYLSEEDIPPVTPSTPNPNNQTNTNAPPLLVYNRITTTIGEPQRISPPQPPQTEENAKETTSNDKEKSKNAKETAVWYEYGCV
ncbi:hypothetical protein NQ314_002536 [Rhamnusium bicolor]|uniref:Girdin n=1 Tax=Rhamnusium bicolor TaxID=1586634 RepID=A0AAV8ZRY6_9CUCU|nr:hypothetical protein NQ314_002536 [Rhamnusium bicolor]